MEVCLLAVTIAVIVEAFIEYIKSIVKSITKNDKKQAVIQCVAIIVAVIMAFVARVDIFAFFGINFSVKWFGNLLTGIFISRGSNYISDFANNVFGKNKTIV